MLVVACIDPPHLKFKTMVYIMYWVYSKHYFCFKNLRLNYLSICHDLLEIMSRPPPILKGIAISVITTLLLPVFRTGFRRPVISLLLHGCAFLALSSSVEYILIIAPFYFGSHLLLPIHQWASFLSLTFSSFSPFYPSECMISTVHRLITVVTSSFPTIHLLWICSSTY